MDNHLISHRNQHQQVRVKHLNPVHYSPHHMSSSRKSTHQHHNSETRRIKGGALPHSCIRRGTMHTITIRGRQRRRLNPNRPQTRLIKLSREMTQEFIRHAKGYDAKQREQQGPGSSDVPPAEDHAEIVCVPSEEHVLPSTPLRFVWDYH
jgi:hypothetical protein